MTEHQLRNIIRGIIKEGLFDVKVPDVNTAIENLRSTVKKWEEHQAARERDEDWRRQNKYLRRLMDGDMMDLEDAIRGIK